MLTIWAAPLGAQDASDPRARAIQLFQESAELYRQGRFADAAEILRAARRLHPEPVLSYNLARALEGAGDLEGAVQAYRDYLEEAPDAEDAPAVRARLEGLESHLTSVRQVEAEREALRAEAERRGPEEGTAPRGPSPVPWIVAGVGGAGLVVGGVLGGLAIARQSEAQREPVHAAAASAAADAGALATGANVCFAVGAVALVAGAIWGIVDVATIGPAASPSAALRLGPGSIELRGQL